MSDSYTFKDVKGIGQWSVKTEFLEKCPNPETLDIKELNEKHFMFKYLHNATAPAGIILSTGMHHPVGYYEFWVNGRRMEIDNPEVAKKMEHNYKFGQKLNKIVDEEDVENNDEVSNSSSR